MYLPLLVILSTIAIIVLSVQTSLVNFVSLAEEDETITTTSPLPAPVVSMQAKVFSALQCFLFFLMRLRFL
jgi:hypothetical protein